MRHRTKKILSYIITIAVIGAAAIWVISKFSHFGDVEFTDNAQVQRQIVPVNSRVQGYIKEIRFKEFERVQAGDTLVIIDDTDLKIDLAQAQADFANAQASRSVTSHSVDVASANVAVSEATIAEAKVLMDNAATDLERYRQLLEQDAVTRREYDGVKTDYEAKKARYEMLAKQRAATSTTVTEARQRISQNEAGIQLAQAMVDRARQNLTYTVITAPCSGFVSRKDIQVGQLVQPGQTLVDIVDESDVWVEANFKETQLAHIHPGSIVRIKVDALPDKEFTGKVVSISTASGAALSLFPQDNSAGNFVKVRQRIPVRIEIQDKTAAGELRAGMNVECEVMY
ncbi:MAG: HlyD family secretion protein [Prevotella sp.]|nr:HlyD family secretion protein [Prevotella sp.]MCM1075186.1 HlyD family secretion protein [Ruminococcus sp.]